MTTVVSVDSKWSSKQPHLSPTPTSLHHHPPTPPTHTHKRPTPYTSENKNERLCWKRATNVIITEQLPHTHAHTDIWVRLSAVIVCMHHHWMLICTHVMCNDNCGWMFWFLTFSNCPESTSSWGMPHKAVHPQWDQLLLLFVCVCGECVCVVSVSVCVCVVCVCGECKCVCVCGVCVCVWWV